MTRIAIIGGGIGGLTTAIALRRYGFDPVVYEQAPQLLDVGAAIAIWSNAMRVLTHLGVSDTVVEHAGTIDEVRWLTSEGRPLNAVSIHNGLVPSVAIHRADLQRILLEALPESSVRLDHTFVSGDCDNDELILSFSCGTTVTCDILIGADGIHSRVRDTLHTNAAPILRGYTVWRAISDSAPASIPSNTALEIHGRGRRFGIGPVGRGRIGWWASANLKSIEAVQQQTHAATENTIDNQHELLSLFDGWYPPVVELIESTAPASILRTEATDRPATTTWGRGRLTLLGDAVHPTTPNLGQGGCMAIEDALVLTRCFEKYGPGEHALRSYERARYERTAAITEYSRLYGRVGQWESRSLTSLRGKAISTLPRDLLKRAMKLVFDYDAVNIRI